MHYIVTRHAALRYLQRVDGSIKESTAYGRIRDLIKEARELTGPLLWQYCEENHDLAEMDYLIHDEARVVLVIDRHDTKHLTGKPVVVTVLPLEKLKRGQTSGHKHCGAKFRGREVKRGKMYRRDKRVEPEEE